MTDTTYELQFPAMPSVDPDGTKHITAPWADGITTMCGLIYDDDTWSIGTEVAGLEDFDCALCGRVLAGAVELLDEHEHEPALWRVRAGALSYAAHLIDPQEVETW